MTGDYRFAGFDVSGSGAGFVAVNASGQLMAAEVWQSADPSESARLRSLAAWTRHLAPKVDVDAIVSLSIEGPFDRGRSSRVLMWAQGAVMSNVFPERWTDNDWATYQPQRVKQTAALATGVATTARGAGKTAMGEAAQRHWPDVMEFFSEAIERSPWPIDDYDKALGDLVDAAWVAETDRIAFMAMLDGGG